MNISWFVSVHARTIIRARERERGIIWIEALRQLSMHEWEREGLASTGFEFWGRGGRGTLIIDKAS